MSRRIYLYLFLVAIILVLSSSFAFSQGMGDVNTEPMSNAAVQTEPAATFNAETPKTADAKPAEETKWVWADVASVDVTNNQIVVKYLDYDTDEEKELTIITDASTRFENADGIKEVTAGDNVGVDYILNDKGQALGKSIALEKSESMPQPSAGEVVPVPVQPEAQPTQAPEVQK